VDDMKRIRSTVDTVSEWYPVMRNLYWGAAAIFNPLKTGLQVVATKAGLSPAFAGFQQNLMGWFYTAYVKELGRYLIELNSGRLKVGAQRYLELMALHHVPPTDEASGERQPPRDEPLPGDGQPRGAGAPRSPEAPPVTLALVGPVKAGKSSLVNALLG